MHFKNLNAANAAKRHVKVIWNMILTFCRVTTEYFYSVPQPAWPFSLAMQFLNYFIYLVFKHSCFIVNEHQNNTIAGLNHQASYTLILNLRTGKSQILQRTICLFLSNRLEKTDIVSTFIHSALRRWRTNGRTNKPLHEQNYISWYKTNPLLGLVKINSCGTNLHSKYPNNERYKNKMLIYRKVRSYYFDKP